MPSRRITDTLQNKKSIVTYLGAAVAIIGIITAIFQFINWIDDYYVDQEEAILAIEKITSSTDANLKTINTNIILLGNAFYDQRIAEIESIITEVEKIENKNTTEVQFLESLKRDHLELKRQQQLLQQTSITPITVGP